LENKKQKTALLEAARKKEATPTAEHIEVTKKGRGFNK